MLSVPFDEVSRIAFGGKEERNALRRVLHDEAFHPQQLSGHHRWPGPRNDSAVAAPQRKDDADEFAPAET